MKLSKQVTELIQDRYSCRTYSEIPIEEQMLDELSNFAKLDLNVPFGSNSRFQLAASRKDDEKSLTRLGTYGFIKGAKAFIIGAMGESEKNLEDFGYAMERIILYATDLGLGTCWLGGTFTKSSFGQRISARADELVPAVVSVGYIAEKARWFESVVRRRANADQRLPWERMFFERGFDRPLKVEAADSFANALEMVRLAPSASNQQPWRVIKDGNAFHFYLSRTPGYRERMLVQLFTVADLQRIDMGIAMCHFELVSEEQGLTGRWEMNEPEIELPDEFTKYTATWISGII